MARVSGKVRRAVKNKRSELMKKNGVVAVMSGKEEKGGKKTGRDAVVVLVEKKLDRARVRDEDIVPSNVTVAGEEIPTGADYLCTLIQTEMLLLHTEVGSIEERTTAPCWLVWHYFLVEVKE